MLSYKHAFHTGNHADTLKHVTLLAVLQKMLNKTKPFCVIDTHAGAGTYPIDDEQVNLNREFETGIAKLTSRNVEHPLLSDYVDISQKYRQSGFFPGSPAFTVANLRDQDKATFIELHANEYEKLKLNAIFSRCTKHHRDGFEGLLALTPPEIKRGVVLIDPPYELADEYGKAASAIEKLIKRWSSASVLLWYPKLTQRAGAKRTQSKMMLDKLSALAVKSAVVVELDAYSEQQDLGMFGSAMYVINAPWQTFETMNDVLKELSSLLDAHRVNIEWIKQPS